MRGRLARRLCLALALAAGAAACGLPEPAPAVRVVAVSPAPDAALVPVALERLEVTFSGAVSAEGLADGARVALVPEDGVRDALAAVESEVGGRAREGLAGAVPVSVALEGGATRLVLRPAAALRGRTAYALVLSSLLRSADGAPVLDLAGQRRPTVARFTTGAPPGPPPWPVLTEVRADAATPEAGGEWVELVNLGEGDLEVSGWRLAKRSASGALSSCPLDAAGDVVAPGGVALVVGGAYDGRYAPPAGVVLVRCGSSGLLGGIANDRPPELVLIDPDGVAVSTLGDGGAAPECPGEVVARLDPEGPDAEWNLACGGEEGTPGEY